MKPHQLIAALVERGGGSLPVAKAMRAPTFQGTLYRICTGDVQSPKRASAERIARHFGIPVDAVYDERAATRAAAELGLLPDDRPNVSDSAPIRHAEVREALPVSLEQINVVLDKSWDDVMREKDDLPERFEVAVPDDSMAPEIPRGQLLTFKRGLTPVAGDGVLVASEAGAVYIRKFRERSGGRWLATPVNPDYAEYDSENDKLRVLAVAISRNIPGRLSGAPI